MAGHPWPKTAANSGSLCSWSANATKRCVVTSLVSHTMGATSHARGASRTECNAHLPIWARPLPGAPLKACPLSHGWSAHVCRAMFSSTATTAAIDGSFFLDAMHAMDCKGVTSVVLGSIIGLLLTKIALGPRRADRLQAINTWLANWYSAHPGSNRLCNIRLTNLQLEGWYELHGPTIKAANTRGAVPAFRDLCREYCTSGSPEDVATLDLIGSLDDFYKVLYTSGIFMTPGATRRLRLLCHTFGQTMMVLRSLAARRNRLWWNIKPKAHKMQHFPFLAKFSTLGIFRTTLKKA